MSTDDEDIRLIDASELGKLIGRSTKTIKLDASRRPHTLPPRFPIPGRSRNAMLWRVSDVRRWMEGIAALAEQQRIEMRQLAAKTGQKFPPLVKHIGHLGKVSTGIKGTELMKKDKQ